MPPPYAVLQANRRDNLETALATFQRMYPDLPQLVLETVWHQSWSLDDIKRVNNTGWANSTGVYFFSDYCTETDPEGEYINERFSFIQRIGVAESRSFLRRLKDYSHFVDSTVGRGASCDKNGWGFRYALLEVIRISAEEATRLEDFFLRTVATRQNTRGVPKHMQYQPILFDEEN